MCSKCTIFLFLWCLTFYSSFPDLFALFTKEQAIQLKLFFRN